VAGQVSPVLHSAAIELSAGPVIPIGMRNAA